MTNISTTTAANDNTASEDDGGKIRLLASSLINCRAPRGEAIDEAINAFEQAKSAMGRSPSTTKICPVASRPGFAFSVPTAMLDLFRACYPTAGFCTSKRQYLTATVINPNGGVYDMPLGRFFADIMLRTQGMALPNGVRAAFVSQVDGPRSPLPQRMELVRRGGDSYLTRWTDDIALKALAEGRCPVQALKEKQAELEPSQIARLLNLVRSGRFQSEADMPEQRAMERLYSALAKELDASREAVPGWRQKALESGLITLEEWESCLGIASPESAEAA